MRTLQWPAAGHLWCALHGLAPTCLFHTKTKKLLQCFGNFDGWAHYSMILKQICIKLTQVISMFLGFWWHLSLVGSGMSLGSHVLSKSAGWDFQSVNPSAHKVDEWIYSILGVSTLSLQHCCNTLGHALNKMNACIHRDLLPLGLHTLPQLIDVARLGRLCCELLLEAMPQMLHRIQIWRLRRPRQHLDPPCLRTTGGRDERCVWNRCPAGR